MSSPPTPQSRSYPHRPGSQPRSPGVCASSSSQGPHAPPSTSRQSDLRWPFKDRGRRGGHRISPRRWGGGGGGPGRFVLLSQKSGASSASLERSVVPSRPGWGCPGTSRRALPPPRPPALLQLLLLPPPLAESECRVQIENTPRIERAYKL